MSFAHIRVWPERVDPKSDRCAGNFSKKPRGFNELVASTPVQYRLFEEIEGPNTCNADALKDVWQALPMNRIVWDDREQRARIIGERLSTEAHFLARHAGGRDVERIDAGKPRARWTWDDAVRAPPVGTPHLARRFRGPPTEGVGTLPDLGEVISGPSDRVGRPPRSRRGDFGPPDGVGRHPTDLSEVTSAPDGGGRQPRSRRSPRDEGGRHPRVWCSSVAAIADAVAVGAAADTPRSREDDFEALDGPDRVSAESAARVRLRATCDLGRCGGYLPGEALSLEHVERQVRIKRPRRRVPRASCFHETRSEIAHDLVGLAGAHRPRPAETELGVEVSDERAGRVIVASQIINERRVQVERRRSVRCLHRKSGEIACVGQSQSEIRD